MTIFTDVYTLLCTLFCVFTEKKKGFFIAHVNSAKKSLLCMQEGKNQGACNLFKPTNVCH